MLPEEVQALLGGVLFFIVASLMLLSQKINAQENVQIFPTNSIVKNLDLK